MIAQFSEEIKVKKQKTRKGTNINTNGHERVKHIHLVPAKGRAGVRLRVNIRVTSCLGD